jgi:glycosyltransferase involved in cell wall biosynthesis
MIGMVSSSNPEMDRLAGELCRRASLEIYVRRYVQKGRWWERALSSLPYARKRSASTFGRRFLAPGLTTDRVIDAGILADFCAAISLRAKLGGPGRAIYSRAMRLRNRAISIEGADALESMDTVIGNYGVAARTFARVKRRGGRTVLNYPNAHHRYSQRLLAEEKELEPDFAATITGETWERAPIFDRECELADGILVGSSFVRETFEKSGVLDKKIVVLPYGSDTTLFSPREGPKQEKIFRVLFVGQLTQRKGLSYLLKAYRAFQGPGTELAIAGRFVCDPALLRRHLDLFAFLGTLAPKQLATAYQSADVFVLPTLLEGMPLVVVEAMASGVPVITTDHGPGDIVRDGIDGYIVPIRDSNAITEKLEYLRANPEIRRQMGCNARQRALEFTWSRYCEAAADAVQKLSTGWRPANLEPALPTL